MKVYMVIKFGWFDTGLEYDRWDDEKRLIFLSKDKAIEHCESITNEELIKWCGGEAEPWYVTREYRWTTEDLNKYNDNNEDYLCVYGRELDIGDNLERPVWSAGAQIMICEQEVIE